MRKILTIIFALLIMATYISCSTESSDEYENLVEKTWYSTNNGWTGNYSRAKWSYTFAECEKISDTEFYVIYETRLFFYTTIPSTSAKRYQTAKLAREKCSKWTYYSKISDNYKKSVTTLNNGTKFYRHKIKEVKYTD